MKKLSILTFIFLCTGLFFNADAQVKKTASSKTVTQKKKLAAKKSVPQKKPVVTKIVQPKDTSGTNTGNIRVRMITDSGVIVLKLYDSTPLHRDNFVKLVSQGFYDSLMFHRVIPQFMIQGGDPLSKNAPQGTMLGNGGGDMARIPAEFRRSLMHKKGALAAARDGNPEKASSAAQFYIVHGKKYNDAELDMLENRKGFKYSNAEREYYKTIGGTPTLDMEYTVFGELESGAEVVDKIANAPRDQANRPLTDIRMRIELIKE